jgi:hypothetical protein
VVRSLSGAPRVPAAIVVAAVVVAGCSDGPERIRFDKALPACSVFVPALTSAGMPGPQLQPSASSSPEGFDCLFTARAGSKAPAVAAVTLQVFHPSYKSDEKDPAKRFGEAFVARQGCSGTGGDNPALPGGSSCYQLRSATYAVTTVTAFARQSAIRVSLDWTDITAWPSKLQNDALTKANAVAASVIGML